MLHFRKLSTVEFYIIITECMCNNNNTGKTFVHDANGLSKGTILNGGKLCIKQELNMHKKFKISRNKNKYNVAFKQKGK